MTSQPVELRILDDVTARLGEVTASAGFDTTVKLVRRQEFDPGNLDRYPAVIVLHDGTALTEERTGGVVIAELGLTIGFVLQRPGDDWVQDLQRFGFDVIRKLTEDLQRGTFNGVANARDTKFDRLTINDAPSEGGDITVGELPARITYGFLETDPTVAV